MTTFLNQSLVFGFRRMFLLVTPNETSFERLEDVPKYVDEAIPYFIGLILLESVVLKAQGKKLPRLNDSFSSLAHGLLSILHSLLFRAVEMTAFLWVYERYNIVTLPWNSPLTWVVCLLAVDLCYYWVHRFGHEVNLFWAGHQTHHSSEDYNLSTALRQSMLQKYYGWIFYMPLGLFLPPSIYLVHVQFNLIYQFWIHTETIDRLGPLEWILSTPSHHRVHHGRNPYCIDKNYGGIFIFWDMLFGTFQAEKREEKPVYGLVHNIDTWDPLYGQFCHVLHMLRLVPQMKGFTNKLSVFLKGPGWTPGKPRLGSIEDLPEVPPNPTKYNVGIPLWNSLYIWTHYLVLLGIWYMWLGHHKQEVSLAFMLLNIGFIVFSLFVFGAMYDNRLNADLMEDVRCTMYFILYYSGLSPKHPSIVYWFYLGSELLWIFLVISRRMSKASKTE